MEISKGHGPQSREQFACSTQLDVQRAEARGEHAGWNARSVESFDGANPTPIAKYGPLLSTVNCVPR